MTSSHPIQRGMGRVKMKETAATGSSPMTVRLIWRAAESYGRPVCCFIRFTLLTATRRSEAGMMVTTRWRHMATGS